jgi:hypothetical protein
MASSPRFGSILLAANEFNFPAGNQLKKPIREGIT